MGALLAMNDLHTRTESVLINCNRGSRLRSRTSEPEALAQMVSRRKKVEFGVYPQPDTLNS